jgi:hypothetical protein|tara:strand:- start:27 stop:482 length:456 start_codon:yes stop_codon:yes gene_type:complete
MKKSSEHNKRYRHAHKERAAAHAIVNRAVRSGYLVRQSCEKCGAEKTEAHHDDYSKPLAVRWLCIPHHKDEHRSLLPPVGPKLWQLRQNEKRKAQRRIAAMSRPIKETKKASLAERAVELRNSGMKYRDIGLTLGMSSAHAYKIVMQPVYK